MPRPVKTPVENMINQSEIPPSAELFTAYLGGWKDANDADKGQSFYTFGFIDQDTVKSTGSDIYYTPIDNSYGFWQFPSTSYTVNGEYHKLHDNTAIADTGTTLALVDDQTCKSVYAAIPGSKISSLYGVSFLLPSIRYNSQDRVLTISYRAMSSRPILHFRHYQTASLMSAAR